MIFETIKNSVPLPEAARRYGIEARGNGMCRCPFHDDRNPSMKLYKDHFYCFGCGAHGDVTELTARLFGLDAMGAARKLITDFNLDMQTGAESPEEKEKIKRKAEEALRKQKDLSAFKLAVRDLGNELKECKEKLDGWKYRLCPKDRNSDPDTWDSRFVKANMWSDRIDDLLDIVYFGEKEELQDLVKKRKEVEAFVRNIMCETGTAFC